MKRTHKLWDSSSRRIVLRAVRGETVAFQLGIEGGKTGVTAVGVQTSVLVSPGGASLPVVQFELIKIYDTEVSDRGSGPANNPTVGKGWYPDALVPWAVGDADAHGGYVGPPFAIKPGEVRGVWCDLTIPYGTAAGEYTGTLTAQSEGERTPLQVALRVPDLDIPRRIHNLFFMNFSTADLDRAGGHWLKGQKLSAYQDAVYRMSRRHRFTAGNVYGEDMQRIEETSEAPPRP